MCSNSCNSERDATAPHNDILCPSARPEMAGAVLHGIVGGTVAAPRIGYLVEPQPVTDALLALANPVSPTEVFRFAAPCAGAACVHFDGASCRLATRVVELLPSVVDSLPPCRIRPQCRWWQQEGRAACLRCPGVVSETCNASPLINLVAAPG
jgi:hypothetical protein